MATDPLQAVDYFGNVIHIGDLVDIYSAKVIGFRADENNRLNVIIVPFANIIQSSDPNNPLTDQVDAKGLIVSGYNCFAYPAANIDSINRSTEWTTLETSVNTKKGAPPAVVELPSNFLAPSLD